MNIVIIGAGGVGGYFGGKLAIGRISYHFYRQRPDAGKHQAKWPAG